MQRFSCPAGAIPSAHREPDAPELLLGKLWLGIGFFILCRRYHGGCRVHQHRGRISARVLPTQRCGSSGNSRVSVSRRGEQNLLQFPVLAENVPKGRRNRSNISRNSSSVTGCATPPGGVVLGNSVAAGLFPLGRFRSGGFFPHRSSPISFCLSGGPVITRSWLLWEFDGLSISPLDFAALSHYPGCTILLRGSSLAATFPFCPPVPPPCPAMIAPRTRSTATSSCGQHTYCSNL